MASRGLWHFMSARSRRGLALSWSALFVLSLLLQYFSFAVASPVTAANATGNKLLGGFEVDGDLFSGTMSPSGDDWAKGATGDGLLTAPTIIDPIGNADTSNFSTGSKENDAPSTWDGGTGTASPKDDMGNIYVGSQLRPLPPGPNSHLWAFVGVERVANNGTTFFDWEFNQKPNVTNANGISVPHRTAGDVLIVAQQLGTGAFTIAATVQVWSGSAWSAPVPAPAGAFYGLSNDASIPKGPWTDQIASGGLIPERQFAEMAFDMTAFGVVLDCPSQGFGEVNVRTRSSIVASAALKDYASAPVRIPPNCASLSWQKEDDQGNHLGGATFTVDPNPFTGTGAAVDFVDYVSASAQSDPTQDQDKRAGYFSLINVVPGTYTVTEKTAPAGYVKDPTVKTITLSVFEDGSISYIWENPAKAKPTLTTTLVGGTPANGKSTLTLDLGNSGTTASFTDSAAFGSLNGNHKPTGSVVYHLYATAGTCTNELDTSTVAIAGDGTIPDSATFTVGLGTYNVVATYAGDVYNDAAASACGDEVVTVVKPNIVASKTVDKTEAVPGDTLHYTITITNNGTGDATGVSLDDDISSILAHGSYNGDVAATSGTAGFSDPNITWTGNLAHGASVTITFSADLDNVFPVGITHVTNAIVVTGRGSNCPDLQAPDPDCKTDTIVPASPDLSAEKTVKVHGSTDAFSHSNTANPGDTLDFKIHVANNGNADADNQTVTDVLSQALVDNSNAFNIATCSPSCTYDAGTRTITWANVDIAAGGSVDLTFSVTLKDTFPVGQTTLGNTVVLAASNCGLGSDDAKCDTTTVVEAAPVLNLEKEVSVNGGAYSHGGSANPGDTLTYRITITNSGNANATGETVTDNLTDVLAHASWLGNLVASSGSGSFVDPNLTWSGISVDAHGGTATLTFQVKLDSVFPAGTTSLPNIAVEANSENCAAQSVDPDCEADTSVDAAPDLAYLKQVSTSASGPWSSSNTANPGDTLFYDITISNSGNANALNQTVKDILSQELVDNSLAFSTATCSPACTYDAGTRTITWTGVTINVGTPVHLTFSLTLKSTFPAGQTTLGNTVVCPDVNERPNPDCTTTTIVEAAPILNLVKEVSVNGGSYSHSGSADPGDTLTYRITVTNSGNANATGESVTDNLTDVLAHASWNDDASASSGTTSFVDPNLTWSGISVAAHGGTATLTFSVTLSTSGWAAGTTDLPNVAVEANSENCAAQSDDPDCATDTTVTTGTDLRITKAVDPSTIGGGVTSSVAYTIVVSNQGDGDTTGNVLVTDDDFPTFYTITGVVCAPTNGTCDAAHLTGSGIDLGILAAHSSVTITVSGSAAPNNTTDVGPHTNTAFACEQVVEGQAVCVHAPAVLTVTLTGHPAIHVVKSASDSSLPFPGGPVTYTYAVTNTGNVPLSNVTLDDDKCTTVAFLGGDTNSDSMLDLAETWSYSCSMSISETTTNIATATGHFGEETVTDTDTKTVVVGPASDLGIAKSFTGNTGGTDPDLDVPAANIGDTLSYTLAYTGSGPLTNAVISDALPQGLEFVDGSAAGNADFNDGTYDAATRTITWHAKGVLPDPASGTVTYDVTVLDTAPEFAQPLVNLATIDSDETAPDTDTASVAVLAPPEQATATPPATSTLTPESAPSNPGFALMLILLGVAGLTLGIGFVTPAPERVRRRNRLG
jgi:uncharacterized repeat protein (TIGR01451 family)